MDPTALGIPWKKQLWHKWKTIRRIPFRKSWFIGYDLEGNSYWELVDHNNPHRLRRKVSLDRPYFHFSDFKPHPMWMQWLQFTRPMAPTLADLINDAKRQYRLKLLTKQAEEKWKSVPLKPSMGGNSDPRLDTAWGGQPIQHAAHPESSSAEGAPEYQPASADAPSNSQLNYQQVLEEVAKRQKNDPKVTRDHLGQVKVQKPNQASQTAQQNPHNSQNTTNNAQSEKPLENRQAQPEWPQPEEPTPEKPESAMFKPKKR